jgi:AbrB family looped-hinge helix DNA binding protein
MHRMPQLLGIATLNEKGQLVIPVEARTLLDLHSGDKLLVVTGGGPANGLLLVRPSSFETAAKKINEHMTNLQDVLKQAKEKIDE